MSNHYSEDVEIEGNLLIAPEAQDPKSVPARSIYRGLLSSKTKHEEALVEINASIAEIETLKPNISNEI